MCANGEDSKDEFEIKKRKTNTTKHPTVDLHNAHEIEVADNTPIRKSAKKATEDSIYSQIDVKNYLKQMSDEVMRYEIRLASLHGRMVELTRENQSLRNDDNYRLICKRLAGKLVAESKERRFRKNMEKKIGKRIALKRSLMQYPLAMVAIFKRLTSSMTRNPLAWSL